MDRVAAPRRFRQEQELLLDVRGQKQQVHDLGDARPADVPQACQSRVVRGNALAHETVQFDGQGHEACHARYAARWQRQRRWHGARFELAAAALVLTQLHGSSLRER